MAAYAMEIEAYWMAEFIIGVAISRQEKAGGPDHPDLAVSLTQLAECAGYKRHVMLTQLYLRKALAIREQAWGGDHLDLADSIRNLSWALSEEHQSEELLALRHRNLALHEKAHGMSSRHLMLPLFDLGTTYSALRQYDNALAQYRRIGELAETDGVELTAEQQELHEFSRHNMAYVHKEKGEFGKSVRIYRSLLDEGISRVGAESPEVVHLMNQLAASLHKSGKLDEAESLYTDAMAILEKNESVRPDELYSGLDNLAEILIDQGRFEQAEPHAEPVIASENRIHGCPK